MIVEIACNNYISCQNAEAAGAHRIELFENLADGGCTPSYGMIKKVKQDISLPIYVMIRPRGGDFVYTKAELDIMQEDVLMCKELVVDGIVFGILTKEGQVDVDACANLLKTWGGRATFHRALDRTLDIEQAMEDIIRLGFERVLSSGGHKKVSAGKEVLKKLQERYGRQIIIMPGAGVTPQNAKALSDYCGTQEIHATCKMEVATDAMSNEYFDDRFSASDMKTIVELVSVFK